MTDRDCSPALPASAPAPSSGAATPAGEGFVHVLFDQPCIPPNTGNAIRMCANTGAHLHLAGPLGFNLEEKNLRRAGLDYHDLARVSVHEDLSAALDALAGARVFAFSSHGDVLFTQVSYQPGDVLLFGTEPTGLDEQALADPRISAVVRLPMVPGNRSMNLSNAAAVATFEAWRQLGFVGAA